MNKIILTTTIFIALAASFPSAAVWEQSTKTALGKVMEYASESWNNGNRYKGQLVNNQLVGLGIHKWSNGEYYIGHYKNDKQDGYGITLVAEGDNIKNCSDCQVYAGNYSAGSKFGKGACYDKNGDLIYYGDFSYNKPVDTYPMTKSYPAYKFETITYSNGGKYIGETKNGERAGYGVFVWASGDAWLGNWKNGTRSGDGIYLSYNASQWETQSCNGDNCTKYTSLSEVKAAAERERYERELAEYNRQMYEYQQYQQQQQQQQEFLNTMNAILQAAQGYNSGGNYNNNNYNNYNNNSGAGNGADCSLYRSRYDKLRDSRDSEKRTNDLREASATGKNKAYAISPEYSTGAATSGDYRLINNSKHLIRQYENDMDKISREARRAGCNVP